MLFQVFDYYDYEFDYDNLKTFTYDNEKKECFICYEDRIECPVKLNTQT